MTTSLRQAPRALLFAALLGSGACTPPRAERGGRCTFNGDCAEGLICAANVCRVQCRDSRDCSSVEFCSASGQPGKRVCLPQAETPLCLVNSECPEGQVCGGGGRCGGCLQSRDCAGTLVCDTRTASPRVNQCVDPSYLLGDGASGDGASSDGNGMDGSGLDASSGDGASGDGTSGDATTGDGATGDGGAGDGASGEGGDASADALRDVVPLDVSCTSGLAECDNDPTRLCEVYLLEDLENCGSCGRRCDATAPPANGRWSCVAGACAAQCNAGFTLNMGLCEARAPRPIAPSSGARTSNIQPIFHWAAGTGLASHRLELQLCRDRSCRDVEASAEYAGDATDGSLGFVTLTAGRHFWRVREHLGDLTAPAVDSVAWPLYVNQLTATPPAGAVGAVYDAQCDVNGDGYADVPVYVRLTTGSAVVAMLLGAPTLPAMLSYGAGRSYTITAHVGANPPHRCVGDYDGDGFSDLAALEDATHVSVVPGGPTGLSSAARWTFLHDDSDVESVVAAGDLDRDGYADFALTHTGSGERAVRIYRGAARSSLGGPVVRVPLAEGSFGYSASAGDMDGDGFAELYTPTGLEGDRHGYVRRLLGYPSFAGAPGAALMHGAVDVPLGMPLVANGDFDANGLTDLAYRVGFAIPGSVVLASSQLGLPPTLTDLGSAETPEFVGDVNGDGYDDLALSLLSTETASSSRSTFVLLFGHGASSTTMPPQTVSLSSAATRTLRGAGDLNGDGFADVVVTDDTDHDSIRVLLGSPGGLQPPLTVLLPMAGGGSYPVL